MKTPQTSPKASKKRKLSPRMAQLQKFEIYPDKELQAYIYQQISEIEPFLIPNTQVAVVLQNEKKAKSVKLVASVPAGKIEVEAEHTDMYAAISEAKKFMLFQIDEINNSEDSLERDMKVRDFMHGHHQLH